MKIVDGAIVWSLRATYGLPFDDVFSKLAENNCVPTWDCFFKSARADGANLNKLVRDISFVVKEAYSTEISAEIIKKLSLMPGYIQKH